MCGLWGAIGRIRDSELKVLYRLALVSVLRGVDSTGMAIVGEDNSVDVYKKTLPSYDFINLPTVVSKLEESSGKARAIIGHCRAKTVGENSIANSHPFEFDNLVGAHNGTIDRSCIWSYLDPHPKKFGTDSEAIFSKLSESAKVSNKDLPDFKSVVSKLEGAWALTVWDKVNNQLQILRNSERTLYCVTSEDDKTLFWASDAHMLRFAVEPTNYKVETYKKSKAVMIRHFEEDTLYTLTPDGLITGSSKGYKGAARAPLYPVYDNGVSRYQNSGYWANGKWVDTSNKSTTTEQPKKLDTKTDRLVVPDDKIDLGGNIGLIDVKHVPNVISPILSPNGTLLHKCPNNLRLIDESDFITDYGSECLFCGGEVEFEVGLVIPHGETKAICHHCVEKDPNILKLMKVA